MFFVFYLSRVISDNFPYYIKSIIRYQNKLKSNSPKNAFKEGLFWGNGRDIEHTDVPNLCKTFYLNMFRSIIELNVAT